MPSVSRRDRGADTLKLPISGRGAAATFHRESDTTVHRDPITKQGPSLVRRAAVEAAQKIPATAGWLVRTRAGINHPSQTQHRHLAVARKLLTLVYYRLRDGHIRALPQPHRTRREPLGTDRARGRPRSDPHRSVAWPRR